MLTLEDRANLYNKAYPKYPSMFYDKKWLIGNWSIGANYKSPNGYYGEFPRGYLNRLMSLFPDKRNILHVFSGSLPKGNYTRVDLNETMNPDFIGNAEELSSFVTNGPFDLFIVDPPYEKHDALRYGYKLPNKFKVIKECFKLATPDAHLCFLDLTLPMYRKTEWTRVGDISLTRSTNHRVRATFIFERTK